MVKQERLYEIVGRLEESPDMPYLMVNDSEALEAHEQIRKIYPEARLLIMKGKRYIAISDKAVRYIIKQLSDEKRQYEKVVSIYDKEINDILEMIENGKKKYFAPDSIIQSRR